MKLFLSILTAISLQACGYTPAEQPTDTCIDVLIASQDRVSAKSERIVDQMIALLSSKSLEQFNPEDAEAARQLAAPMREIFIENHEIASTLLGEPVPITAGSGFGTLKAGEAENLFGIYQANTPSAACNYPFAPSSPKPIEPDDVNSGEVPFVVSKVMSVVCKWLPDCTSMESSLFLNVSNEALQGTRNKLFFDDAVYDMDSVVYKTFADWHPGDAALPNTNWAERGFDAYENGDMQGQYVVYQQSNMKQNVLLFYRPFEDKHGEFAGVAYAFVNLYEEFLVNDVYAKAVDDGICSAPPRNCSTGE